MGGDHVLVTQQAAGSWTLRAAGATLSLEPSVYLDAEGRVRRSQQAVLSGETQGPATTVKWALRRQVGQRGGAQGLACVPFLAGWVGALLAAGVTFGLTWGGLALLIPVLTRHRIFDQPNPRSSHTTSTPRGGGIAVMTGGLVVWVGCSCFRPWGSCRIATSCGWWLPAPPSWR